MSFEQSITKADEIIKKIESGDVSLEETLKLFNEGKTILGDCRKTLDEAEFTVTVVE